MTDKIEETILRTVRELNTDLNNDALENPTSETALFGLRGNLDSLALVNLIADLEECIRDEFDQDVILADEKAMSLRNSPFRTVGTLRDYIAELLESQA